MNLNVVSVKKVMQLERNESKTFWLEKLNIQRHLLAARINACGISSRLRAQMMIKNTDSIGHNNLKLYNLKKEIEKKFSQENAIFQTCSVSIFGN